MTWTKSNYITHMYSLPTVAAIFKSPAIKMHSRFLKKHMIFNLDAKLTSKSLTISKLSDLSPIATLNLKIIHNHSNLSRKYSTLSKPKRESNPNNMQKPQSKKPKSSSPKESPIQTPFKPWLKPSKRWKISNTIIPFKLPITTNFWPIFIKSPTTKTNKFKLSTKN